MALFQDRRKKPYMIGSLTLLAASVAVMGVLAFQGPAGIREEAPQFPTALPTVVSQTADPAPEEVEAPEPPATPDENSVR